MSAFLHGVEVVEIDSGARPIQTVRSSVIGLVGTAPEAEAASFPLNTPVLIAGSRTEAAALGAKGTLPQAIDGIFDQAGALVVVVRVADDKDAAKLTSNVIGGVDSKTAQRTGLQALLDASSVVAAEPRILIAPGFSHQQAVAAELESIAARLRAVAIVDGPNSDDKTAIAYRKNFGSPRVYMVDPWVKYWDTVANAEAVQPTSARVAGLIARSDQERGFWWSPSNREILGITGTARAIDFALGDANARANLLNEQEVATIIRQDGYRLWGNRTCSADPKWAFLSVRRTADMINESLLQAHLWAVDRNITKTYTRDVIDGVRAYLRELEAKGAIAGGDVWVDKELNTAATLAAGKVVFDFDFAPYSPAERVTFRSQINNSYLEEVLDAA